MQVETLRAALRQHRLDRNMSYEELASDISRTLGQDRKLSLRTVYSFIEGDTNPYETTAHLIGEYLRAQGIAA